MHIKKIIPNLLTSMRLVVIPFIIMLGLKDKYEYLAIVGAIVALTDFFDGMLARRWNVCSEFGARLDSASDKLLAISLLIVLILKNYIFLYMLILEIAIAVINLIIFYRTRTNHSLLIGKIKTWGVYTSLVLGFINLFYSKFNGLLNFLVVITVILQIMSFIAYFKNGIDVYSKKKRPSDEELKKEQNEIIKEIVEHPEYQKRKTYNHHYNESVYEHCLRVSFDAFCIAKKHGWNYKDAAIAGVLHDFYYKPWQENIKNVPLLQKHGFVHAKEALDNSRKYFSKYLNPVIENSIERHMFPLNRKMPKYKIGWLIVLVDKADSMDFLAHPSVFMKCFVKKSKKKK